MRRVEEDATSPDLKAHIARLERDGHDASESIKLLRIFETTLELMIDYRNQLARTLPDRSVSGLSAIAATILERERPRTAGFGSPDSGLPANATEVGVEVDTFPEYVAACAHISGILTVCKPTRIPTWLPMEPHS